jgi:hypothetical protein
MEGNPRHEVFEDKAGPAVSAAVGPSISHDVDARNVIASWLLRGSRGDDRHVMPGSGERLGLKAHPDVLGVREVLEKHDNSLDVAGARLSVGAA